MKILISAIFLSIAVFASEGLEVYKKHCASCHLVMLPQKEPERSEVKKQMKAPTMRMVAMRLKMMINIKNSDEDIQKKVTKSFIKEYIEYPDEDYVICMESIVEKFGLMKPIKVLTLEEKEAVAEWLWEQY